jgi:hypothetical protein
VYVIDSFWFDIFPVPPKEASSYATYAYNVYTSPASPYILTFSDSDYIHNTANKMVQFTTSGTKEVCAVAWRQLYSESICKTFDVVLSVKDETLNNKIMVAPNPVKDQLNIATALNSNDAIQYQIVNTLGGIVSAGNATAANFNVDVSALHAGIYFIRLQSGNAATVKRFVKE